jgi:hypothetical protein
VGKINLSEHNQSAEYRCSFLGTPNGITRIQQKGDIIGLTPFPKALINNLEFADFVLENE